nr:PREDICTED: uncharacterized protein LOC107077463 [Lepisosteus oculatus]
MAGFWVAQGPDLPWILEHRAAEPVSGSDRAAPSAISKHGSLWGRSALLPGQTGLSPRGTDWSDCSENTLLPPRVSRGEGGDVPPGVQRSRGDGRVRSFALERSRGRRSYREEAVNNMPWEGCQWRPFCQPLMHLSTPTHTHSARTAQSALSKRAAGSDREPQPIAVRQLRSVVRYRAAASRGAPPRTPRAPSAPAADPRGCFPPPGGVSERGGQGGGVANVERGGVCGRGIGKAQRYRAGGRVQEGGVGGDSREG